MKKDTENLSLKKVLGYAEQAHGRDWVRAHKWIQKNIKRD